ncbi:MAG: ABC-F family ATP-binding cassette domain-containing protein, partial [Syntrophomonadaceae bacterium]|nr:ABC-F family ATP-binding cassette domain-containing protein [Syntrophomonadaceae bacterium]
AALLNPADLMILDEPTNHLDNQAIDWLEEYLQRFHGALLMVTHDRYFLERVSSRIIELDKAQLFSYPGNYSTYLERKLEREAIEVTMADKKQALLRQELAWIRKGARARRTKQKARIQRFEKLQEDNVQIKGEKLQISHAASRLGKKTIILEGVFHGFQGEKLIQGYSCILDRGERLGLVGANGIGKTTLLKIMSGELIPEQGRVDIGSTVKIGYFPQESTGLPEEMRVIEYIREAGEFLQAGKKLLSASQMLETFLFSPASQWNTLQKLSGGEKRRLHLLRILMGAPNILLLDEPGNDLDIETLTILEDYLDDFPGAVIAVSHDRYFLDRICEKILAFEGMGKLNEYPGNYSDYLQYLNNQMNHKSGQDAKAAGDKKPNFKEEKKAKLLKFSFKEQKEFEEIDARIAAVEDELHDINSQVDHAAQDYQQLEKLVAIRQVTLQHLDELMERWAYLNELAEVIEKQRN